MAFGDEYVTVAEAVKRTGYTRWHIAYLLKHGHVPGIKPGHDWFVHLPSLIEYQKTARPGRRPKRRGADAE